VQWTNRFRVLFVLRSGRRCGLRKPPQANASTPRRSMSQSRPSPLRRNGLLLVISVRNSSRRVTSARGGWVRIISTIRGVTGLVTPPGRAGEKQIPGLHVQNRPPRSSVFSTGFQISCSDVASWRSSSLTLRRRVAAVSNAGATSSGSSNQSVGPDRAEGAIALSPETTVAADSPELNVTRRHVVAENDPGDVFTNVRLVDVSIRTQLATHDQRELHLVVQQLGLSRGRTTLS